MSWEVLRMELVVDPNSVSSDMIVRKLFDLLHFYTRKRNFKIMKRFFSWSVIIVHQKVIDKFRHSWYEFDLDIKEEMYIL